MGFIRPPEEILELLRPDHIDCVALGQVASEIDDDEDIEELVPRCTGISLAALMKKAMENCIGYASIEEDVRTAAILISLQGDCADYLDYLRTAFLGGLGTGLEMHRGRKMPPKFHMNPDQFWDLDGPSVQWVTDQRLLRAMYNVESDDSPRGLPPMLVMMTLYMDGLVIGTLFDDRRALLSS